VDERGLIRGHLELEDRHLAAVTALLRASFERASADPHFMEACADYLQLMLARLADHAEPHLESAWRELRAAPAPLRTPWLEFLEGLTRAARRRSTHLESLSAAPVQPWRRAARLDADAVLNERTRYGRLLSVLPQGLAMPDPPESRR
jgi:hypothetical protein